MEGGSTIPRLYCSDVWAWLGCYCRREISPSSVVISNSSFAFHFHFTPKQEKIPANSFVVEYAGDVINFGEMQARVHKYETNGFHNFCFEIFKTDDTANEFWKFPCVDSLVSL